MTLNTTKDLDIQALVDGELDNQKITQVLHFIQIDPEAKKRHGELIKQKTILKKWWYHSQN